MSDRVTLCPNKRHPMHSYLLQQAVPLADGQLRVLAQVEVGERVGALTPYLEKQLLLYQSERHAVLLEGLKELPALANYLETNLHACAEKDTLAFAAVIAAAECGPGTSLVRPDSLEQTLRLYNLSHHLEKQDRPLEIDDAQPVLTNNTLQFYAEVRKRVSAGNDNRVLELTCDLNDFTVTSRELSQRIHPMIRRVNEKGETIRWS